MSLFSYIYNTIYIFYIFLYKHNIKIKIKNKQNTYTKIDKFSISQ